MAWSTDQSKHGSHRHKTPLSLGGDSSYHSGRMRWCWVPACTALLRTKGLFCLIVKTQCLLLKYTRELKGACMNHKYLHAINVWTKELDRLSWENSFSHEKQCFELQSIFNFISSIANLKSQCLLGITLSGPQSSRRLRRKGRPGSLPRNLPGATRDGPLTDRLMPAAALCLQLPRSLARTLSLKRPDPGLGLHPGFSHPGKAKPAFYLK